MQPTNVSMMKEDVVMEQLPKNIRQVGEPDGGYRIYMEDYVHTFVKKAQELAGNELCAGILLGKSAKIESEQCVFINGAILVEELQGKNGELQFTASVWKKIYEDIRKFFPQLTMQGWFVVGKEDAQIDMISLERVHRNAFSQEESILYLCYGEEMGVWKNIDSNFIELHGFYIYYEKNEAMQAYMMEIGQSSPSERATKDETVQNFRAIMERKKTEHHLAKPIIQGIGMVSVAAVLFLAVNAWRQNGQLFARGDDIETSGYEDVVQVGADVSVADNLENQSSEEQTIESTTIESQIKETQAMEEQTIEDASVAQESESSSEDSAQASALVNYYEIKKGDTLVGISMSFYGTLSMVEEICRLNHIENPNAIYTGQKIRLP